jgi:hypothetical protein
VAEETWNVIKICYCDHAGEDVGLEVKVVYPVEWLPDQPPRIRAHRCSHGLQCNLEGKPSCIWSGANPVFDPFVEKR